MSKSSKSYNVYILGLLFLPLIYLRCDLGNKNSTTAFEPVAIAYDGLGYAGSQTCAACHEDIYNLHIKTPHFNTSKLISASNISGDFTENNTLELNNSIRFEMTYENHYYQTAFKDNNAVRKEPFDIVVGSGTKGQSYLYWNDAKLYQLPVSYLTKSKQWIHSPGYSNERIHFDRAVIPNCLECHATFARNRLPSDFGSNNYVKNEMIYGVDCESCHGPSLKHVNAHSVDPHLKSAEHIMDIKALTQQQQLDACARCHSGLRKPLKMPFTFKTGDKLDSFRMPNHRPIDTTTLDVHGNQYGLLKASVCFKKSESLTCTTCHNPHKNERGHSESFSQICMGCHQDSKNHQFPLNDRMKVNCITCHMPLLKSSAITFKESKNDSVMVRTHNIGIYTDITKGLYRDIKE
ncbi:multiheme c-type cytochrome [Winogradskyella flava]|uniref:Cytochrome c-552/4 domain-containing protein n=1 Tax=Winogradskyella flava TaxID=1884876 RepID=A0A842ITP5_9FLAO|nr:multiheme c-type cytochrome [Winogradskyella flava]MBC2845113.1 hypothetical protein [Winogradskyella flava]